MGFSPCLRAAWRRRESWLAAKAGGTKGGGTPGAVGRAFGGVGAGAGSYTHTYKRPLSGTTCTRPR